CCITSCANSADNISSCVPVTGCVVEVCPSLMAQPPCACFAFPSLKTKSTASNVIPHPAFPKSPVVQQPRKEPHMIQDPPFARDLLLNPGNPGFAWEKKGRPLTLSFLRPGRAIGV